MGSGLAWAGFLPPAGLGFGDGSGWAELVSWLVSRPSLPSPNGALRRGWRYGVGRVYIFPALPRPDEIGARSGGFFASGGVWGWSLKACVGSIAGCGARLSLVVSSPWLSVAPHPALPLASLYGNGRVRGGGGWAISLPSLGRVLPSVGWWFWPSLGGDASTLRVLRHHTGGVGFFSASFWQARWPGPWRPLTPPDGSARRFRTLCD